MGENSMSVEYELKFRATEPIQRALLAVYGKAPKHYDMETTYYDTPSGALSARHYTLRRRMENEKSVCTLKTPAEGGRLELETVCQDIAAALPVLQSMGAPEDFLSLTAEGLCPVCGAKFHRVAMNIALEGCTVELALDQGVLIGGDRTVPLCEVEVELKAGDPACADRFALEIAENYGLLPETKSKFRRALALSKE